MKKTLQVLLIALFTFAFASAQDELYPVGDLNYRITNGSGPLEVEVAGFLHGEPEVTGEGEDQVTRTTFLPVANVVVPETVTISGFEFTVVAIGEDAFNTVGVNGNKDNGGHASNAGIVTVSLPKTVVTIKNEAFATQRALTTINTENVVTFGTAAFGVCDKLTNVDLSSAVTLGNYCFNRCHAFTGELKIPNVTSIGVGSIYNSSVGAGIQAINIPADVTKIGALFLGRITTLTQVQVNWTDPADVDIDGKNFFRTTDIAGGVINLYVPVGTKALYEAAEPWGANSIAGSETQYFNHANIIEGDMPELVVSKIGSTFTSNDISYKVTSEEPNQVEVAGSTLANVVIPETATDAETGVTYDVIAVTDGGFLNNTTVVSVSLPASVKTLYKDAFSGCENLETINLEHIEAFSGQNTFFNTPKLTTANLASATELVGNFGFHGLGDSSLTSVNIPKAVTLGRALFSTAQFQTINIPVSVDSISTKTFWNCTALTDVQVNWTSSEDIPLLDTTQDVPASTDPETGTEIAAVAGNAAFLGVDVASVNLLVPAGTESLYAGAEGWKDFNIVVGQLSAADIVNNSLNIQVSAEALTVTSSSTFTNGNLSIYDITGRELSSTALNSASASVSISNLASGVYIVKVTEGNAKLVKRFVKQ